MKDYDYYTVDEIIQALESNTDEVLTRTIIWSKRIVGKSGFAIEAEEVFNEALLRILDDDRHVPKVITTWDSLSSTEKTAAGIYLIKTVNCPDAFTQEIECLKVQKSMI